MSMTGHCNEGSIRSYWTLCQQGRRDWSTLLSLAGSKQHPPSKPASETVNPVSVLSATANPLPACLNDAPPPARSLECDSILHGLFNSCAGNPNCKIAVVMGKSRTSSVERHKQHSMILVPLDTPGVKLIRPLSVFGYDDAFHGGHFEIHFEDVHVPLSSIILGEGRGFEIAQGRLGPGRLHHCMRTIGLAERALELLCQRAACRETFGKKLYQHEVVAHWIAECRIIIEQTRLLTLNAANSIDSLGSAAARKEIAMIKVAAARMACKVVDYAIQVHGGGGVSQDFPLAQMYAVVRTLRFADGPDEVHLSAIAKMEITDQLEKFRAKM